MDWGVVDGMMGGSIHQSSTITHITPRTQASRWRLYPLHSQLPMDQQRAIFQPPPSGLRKVRWDGWCGDGGIFSGLVG